MTIRVNLNRDLSVVVPSDEIAPHQPFNSNPLRDFRTDGLAKRRS